MTKKTRKLLFTFFVILFLTISPTIIFLASGYRYDFINKSVQKTGLISIKSKPEDALILLNNKKQYNFFNKYFSKNKQAIISPANIPNLLPGNYIIDLKKEGYWGWRKSVNLLPNKAINFKNVFLFKKNDPEQIIDSKIENLYIAPDKKNILIKAGNDFHLLNLRDETISKLDLSYLKNDITRIIWSKDSKSIYFNNLEYDLKNKSWLEFINISISKDKQELKYASNIGYQYNQILEKDNFKKLNNTTNVFSTELEIWKEDINSLKKTLLTNIDLPIQQIEILPKENFIIYLVENAIYALEVEDSGDRILIKLIEADNLDNLYFYRTNNVLYFSAKINKVEGFYKLEF